MLREVYEETGLILTGYQYRGIVTFVSDRYETEYMHLFTATGFRGTLKDCREGDLRWIPKDQVFSLNLWEGDRAFLSFLMEDKDFFSMKLVYEGDSLVKIQSRIYGEK